MTHEFAGFREDVWPVIVLWRHTGTWTNQEVDRVRGRVTRLINIDRNGRRGHLLVLLRQQAGRKRFLSLFGKLHHSYFALAAKTWVGERAIRGRKEAGRFIDFDDLERRLERARAKERVAAERRLAKLKSPFRGVLRVGGVAQTS